MSIERRERKKGVVYLVWWRDGRRSRNRTFERKRDAEAFEAKVKLAKRAGRLGDIDAGRQRLSEFIEEWWEVDAEPRLAQKTLILYRGLKDRYIVPRLGSVELRQLNPAVIQRFQADLLQEGVGRATVRKVVVLLGGMLERAVEWGRLPGNPVRAVRKPPDKRQRAVRPIAPLTVEQLRARLLRKRRHRDAVLISVLAYSGLRPGEALALTWSDIRKKTILVDKAISLGEVQHTKNRRSRSVTLLGPLAADLAEWQLARGRPDAKELVFPTAVGDPWQLHDYQNWRRRVYVPAAEAVGIESPRPYDLRHSFCSLLLAEGRNPIEVAQQLGHSPLMTLNTYGHLIEELRGQKTQSAEALIKKARQSNGHILVTQTRE